MRSGDRPQRLVVTWLDGPWATVEALCGLGIPTDHLATVDLAGFAAVVDATGGLPVDVPEPVRDQPAGLLLDRAGQHTVDGDTALALVRSRHPEHRVGGAWVPTTVDPNGRAATAGTVLTALTDRMQEAVLRPDRLQSVAWAVSGALDVDTGTSTADLLALHRRPGSGRRPAHRGAAREHAGPAADRRDRGGRGPRGPLLRRLTTRCHLVRCRAVRAGRMAA